MEEMMQRIICGQNRSLRRRIQKRGRPTDLATGARVRTQEPQERKGRSLTQPGGKVTVRRTYGGTAMPAAWK